MSITISSRGNWSVSIFTEQAAYGPYVDCDEGIWSFAFGILHFEFVSADAAFLLA